MADLIRLKSSRKAKAKGRVAFSQTELRMLLSFYSARVISGEWRDYAIDFKGDVAVFSIFRRTQETPTLSVTKSDRSGHGKPAYALFDGPRQATSSSSLGEVLNWFQSRPRLVSG
jgi:hypothetical protein